MASTQQAITYTNADQAPRLYIASLGHYMLIYMVLYIMS